MEGSGTLRRHPSSIAARRLVPLPDLDLQWPPVPFKGPGVGGSPRAGAPPRSTTGWLLQAAAGAPSAPPGYPICDEDAGSRAGARRHQRPACPPGGSLPPARAATQPGVRCPAGSPWPAPCPHRRFCGQWRCSGHSGGSGNRKGAYQPQHHSSRSRDAEMVLLRPHLCPDACAGGRRDTGDRQVRRSRCRLRGAQHRLPALWSCVLLCAGLHPPNFLCFTTPSAGPRSLNSTPSLMCTALAPW